MKHGDEVIRKGRYIVREGKIIGEVPGGYEILMSDKTIVYGNEKDFELRYEEDKYEEKSARETVKEILLETTNLMRNEADHVAGMIIAALQK